MSVLIEGLPDEALCKQPAEADRPWSETKELLARILEEVSIMAANHQRAEPLDYPRPGPGHPAGRAPAEGLTGSEETGFEARGLSGMLAAAAMYGAGPAHA